MPDYHAAVKHPLSRLLGVIGFGALASQAGHLLVYQVQFGSAAAAAQSEGAHAYFPIFAKTTLGLATALLLAGLLIIGAARLASGRPVRRASSPAILPLLSILFTAQLTFFITQETIEALAAGTAPPHVESLLFLGAMGQLPVAAVAALAVKWLGTRFEFAVVSLRLEIECVTAIFVAQAVLLPWQHKALQVALAEASPASFAKRGPPQYLLG